MRRERQKVVLVGHSAGGVDGQALSGAEALQEACLRREEIRPGPDHAREPPSGQARLADAAAGPGALPGTFFAPEVGYLSVAGKAVRGDRRRLGPGTSLFRRL
ncbi:MAG: hypothetical protein MZU79_07240 [Anaerotruncus sp.]|nr:hypothetical protein [Anaerotruncus sp.]